jgi:DNA mismatch repair protein MutS2
VRFDKTIATLQKNVLNWKNLSNAKRRRDKEAREEGKDGIHQCQNKTKLESYQELYDSNKRQSILVKSRILPKILQQ